MADNFNESDQAPPVGPKSVTVPGSIADGTLGELLTWDVAGLAALVPAGAAGFVLTANAGAAPTFQAGGGAPVASVFGRTGVVVAVAGDYTSTLITNLSGVSGATVTAALNTLDAAITPHPVTSVFGRVGAVVAVGGDYSFPLISGAISGAQHAAQAGGTLHADVIAAGASGFMTGADKTKLNGIATGAQVNTVTSVFARVGAIVAVAGDYTSTLITNLSTVFGATVTAALNALRGVACQARRTTAYTLTTAYADIDLNSTDVENDAAIIDHLAGTPDRITFVVAGTFEVHYHYTALPPASTDDVALVESRVRVNDTTVLPGSIGSCTTFNDGSIDGDLLRAQVGVTFERVFAAADFISLQAQKTHPTGTSATTLNAGSIVMTAKLVRRT